MTVGEIFSTVANHMIKGVMIHEELANYYDFLSLKGYKRCHEYHYLEESCYYRKWCRYYINHYNKLIPNINVEKPDVIPDSWYRYTRQEVDNNTKRNAVKSAMQIWVDWETETKDLYQRMYKELLEIGEIASAKELECYICDVDCELKKAERYQIDKKAIDYDMTTIVLEQHDKHEKYKEKTLYVGKTLC